MSENETTPDSPSEERIRKVYVKDLKVSEGLHTVFRATQKQHHQGRSGKSFLALRLVDKTGEIDGRVFENIEAAEASFQDDDYLLVKGKVILFHGKPQIVIDALERLDAGPIDPKEFIPPPSEARAEKETHREPKSKNNARTRLLAALEDPVVERGLEALLRHLENYVDERVQARLNGERPRDERPPKEQRHKGPKVEVRPKIESAKEDKRPERDSSLPKDLAFKPFDVLTAQPADKT